MAIVPLDNMRLTKLEDEQLVRMKVEPTDNDDGVTHSCA
jgi:hypothetical protein